MEGKMNKVQETYIKPVVRVRGHPSAETLFMYS
jgi:hypothetical protein